MDPSGKTEDIACGICNLGISKHVHIRCVPVEIKCVAPAFLVLGHHMDLVSEEEHLSASVIPASVGRKHVLVLPHVCCRTECCEIEVRLINERPRLHEDGIGEHVHVIGECEGLYLGIICSVAAFDYLTVLVTHCTAFLEHGDRVFGIIVQMSGPQCIMILVSKLDNGTSEFGEVHIDEISKLVTGKDSLLLENANIAPCLDDLGLDIPQSRVAEQICAVMEKSCRTYDLSVACTGDVHHLGRLGTQQDDQAVPVFL